MKRLRGVLQRLPSLFDRGALDAACNELWRHVPIDHLALARVADDGSYLRLYMVWRSPDVGVPAIEWARRIDVPREKLERTYPRGRHRICRDTRQAPDWIERALADAGILCTLSVPIGRPLQGIVGFGFASADRLRAVHLPLLRRIAAMLIERLDRSLEAAQAARLRTMTATMPMGALMGHGTVEEVNPAAERLLGRSAAELMGRSVRELVCAPDGGLLGWRLDVASGPAPALVRTPEGMRPVQAQLAAVRRDVAQPHLYGPLFLVDTHLALVDDLPVIVNVRVHAAADGRITGFEGFAIDITRERNAQRQLMLADRLAALGMLVAGIGHEINNPAAYVSLGVQQIARHLRGARSGRPEELHAVILDDVASGVHRIADIVGELKLFARNPTDEAAGAVDLNDIVRRLGGTIDVASELGRGTTFTVTLPCACAEAARRASAALPSVASGSVRVVDDEEPLAAAIARELGACMQVELAHSGGAALAALERGRFDAVLCDLRMPDVSGAAIYRQVAERDRCQADRFVFLTGAAAAPGEAEFLRAAGRPILEKPFAMAELWRTVGAVVGASAS